MIRLKYGGGANALRTNRFHLNSAFLDNLALPLPAASESSRFLAPAWQCLWSISSETRAEHKLHLETGLCKLPARYCRDATRQFPSHSRPQIPAAASQPDQSCPPAPHTTPAQYRSAQQQGARATRAAPFPPNEQV